MGRYGGWGIIAGRGAGRRHDDQGRVMPQTHVLMRGAFVCISAVKTAQSASGIWLPRMQCSSQQQDEATKAFTMSFTHR